MDSLGSRCHEALRRGKGRASSEEEQLCCRELLGISKGERKQEESIKSFGHGMGLTPVTGKEKYNRSGKEACEKAVHL